MKKLNEFGKDAETRILAAAKQVFVQKGMNGAVMQDIADTAQISRTALHYYFRSKQKLFEAVLQDLFEHFMPQVVDILREDRSFADKLRQFVHEYLDLLRANPYLPNFIMNELNKNPEKIIARFARGGLMSAEIREQVAAELRQLNPAISPAQFVMSLTSMCVFPFIAKPLIKEFLIGGAPDAFDRFIEERKSFIVDMLMNTVNPPEGSTPATPSGRMLPGR